VEGALRGAVEVPAALILVAVVVIRLRMAKAEEEKVFPGDVDQKGVRRC